MLEAPSGVSTRSDGQFPLSMAGSLVAFSRVFYCVFIDLFEMAAGRPMIRILYLGDSGTRGTVVVIRNLGNDSSTLPSTM